MATLDKQKLIKTLASLKLDGWALLLQTEEKSSLYLTKGERIETSLSSKRTSADITIYKKYGKQIGDARFSVFNDDEAALTEKVRDALLLCATAKKQAYPLAKKQAYATVAMSDARIQDAFAKGTQETLTLRLWETMRTAARAERNVVVNAAEIHLRNLRSEIRNSAGVDVTSARTELFVEAVFTSFSGTGKARMEQEHHAAETYCRVADFDPKYFVRHSASLARDILAAKPLGVVHEGRILLTGEALREFWAPNLDLNPTVFQAGAQVKHRKLSRYEIGKRITTNKGFSIGSNPRVPYNPGSGRCDLDGVASLRVPIITNGVVQRFFASQRYAHYLKIKPTGALGVIELSSGKEKASALASDGTIEIVAFSSFTPNSMSGDFSAEIRLAYLRQGGKKVPVRAAMFSGNIFTMLDTMRLAKERVVRARYSGPATVRFDDGCRLAGF